MIKIFLLAGVLGFITGCGVKGDPLPPLRPTELGRGRPTFHRALKGVKPEVVPDNETENEEDNDNEQDSEEQ